MLRAKFLLLLCLLCFFSLKAQVVTIKDATSGEPLEMVTLFSENPKAHTTTNSKGQANISTFKDSKQIHIMLFGYKTETKTYDELKASSFIFTLTSSGISMDEVVVSASRSTQTTKDIPSKVISISTKDVALQNPQTTADLLGSSGKVFIQKSQQGGGSPMIRGFATNRLLYSVDGVRMNTAIFRAGNIQNVISLDPYAIEKTEVFFGPGSVIYGSDAIGGVMSFQTLTPQYSLNDTLLFTGKGVTRFASANSENTFHADFNLGGKKFASLTSVTHTVYDDLKMGSIGPDDYLRTVHVQRINGVDSVIQNSDPRIQTSSGYSQLNLMQKFRYNPHEKWDFQYGFHYSETSDYARYDRHLRMRNDLPRYAEWSYGPQIWMMNNLTITHHDRNPFYEELTIRLAQQYFEESRIDRNLNDDIRNVQTEQVNAYSANVDFTKLIKDRNTLYYGVEYVMNDVISLGELIDISTNETEVGPSRYPKSTWTSMGVYATNHFKVNEKFIVQVGARYNQFILDAQFDTTFVSLPFTTANINKGALTGSLGFVYRPTDKWVLSSNFATAFRSPNVDDLGKIFDSEVGTVTVPNPNLRAEYAYNADFGVAKIFKDIFKIDVSAFYTLLDNALVRRDFTLNGQDSILYFGEMSQVQAIQNAAFATVYGVQTGFEWNMIKHLKLSTDFNYQIGEEELDDGSVSPSRHAAPWFTVSRLTYANNKLSVQFYSIYNAERSFEDMPEEEKGKPEIYAADANGNPYTPAWYTLNLKALYNFGKLFSVSAGIENITDQRYRPYSSGIAAAGRNFILSVRAGF
ncbi:MAG: TonB-dependent receptor domain-containing protein [Bacteroidia bacterium]